MWLLLVTPKVSKTNCTFYRLGISQDEHASQGVQEVIKVLNESIESKIEYSKSNEEAFEAVGGEYPNNVDLFIDEVDSRC